MAMGETLHFIMQYASSPLDASYSNHLAFKGSVHYILNRSVFIIFSILQNCKIKGRHDGAVVRTDDKRPFVVEASGKFTKCCGLVCLSSLPHLSLFQCASVDSKFSVDVYLKCNLSFPPRTAGIDKITCFQPCV